MKHFVKVILFLLCCFIFMSCVPSRYVVHHESYYGNYPYYKTVVVHKKKYGKKYYHYNKRYDNGHINKKRNSRNRYK